MKAKLFSTFLILILITIFSCNQNKEQINVKRNFEIDSIKISENLKLKMLLTKNNKMDKNIHKKDFTNNGKENFYRKFLISLILIIITGFITFYITKWSYDKSFKNNRICVLELSKSYFLTTNQLIKDTKVLKDTLLINDHYISQLETINNNLKSFMNNSYFLAISKDYNELTLLQIFLNRELLSLKKNKNQIAQINAGTFKMFYKLWDKLKIDYKKKIQKDDILFGINSFVIRTNNEINKQSGYHDK